jgi:hypothetical protein
VTEAGILYFPDFNDRYTNVIMETVTFSKHMRLTSVLFLEMRHVIMQNISYYITKNENLTILRSMECLSNTLKYLWIREYVFTRTEH